MSATLDRRNSAAAFTTIPEPTSRAAAPSELAFCGIRPRNDWDTIIDELLRMRELQDDWDGEWASIISRAANNACKTEIEFVSDEYLESNDSHA